MSDIIKTTYYSKETIIIHLKEFNLNYISHRISHVIAFTYNRVLIKIKLYIRTNYTRIKLLTI